MIHHDPDNDPLSIHSIDTLPTNGTAVISEEKIRYAPDEGFIGSDSLVYNITDGNGEYDTATLFIEIIDDPGNEPPIAKDDYYIIYEDSSNNIFDVLTNDTDPGDTITLDSIEIEPTNGIAEIDGDTISYLPYPDFAGFDTLTYKISDNLGANDTAQVFITIININDFPVANNDEVTVYFNSSINEIDVLANDSDPDGDAIRVDSIVTLPTNGTVSIDEIQNLILYTPDKGFIGTDCFEYNITDDKGGNDTAIVTVNVVKNISGIIVKPRKDYLYFINRESFKITKLLQFINADALIIGPINVKIEIDDLDFKVEKVEFYINGELKNTTTKMPYNWTFNERLFRICTINVVAHGEVLDKKSIISNEIDVLILNLGLSGNRNK